MSETLYPIHVMHHATKCVMIYIQMQKNYGDLSCYIFDIFSQILFYFCYTIVWTLGCSLICNTFVQHEEIILYMQCQYPVGYFFGVHAELNVQVISHLSGIMSQLRPNKCYTSIYYQSILFTKSQIWSHKRNVISKGGLGSTWTFKN